jgi:hypothetical protein
VRQVIYVIVVVILVAIVIGALVMRRKTNVRGFNYAPDPNLRSGAGGQVGVRPGPGAVPQIPIATPEYQTEAIVHDEFVSDVSDDLLNPRNPHHAEWVMERPDMETDAEWLAQHPEDNPA